jgi:formylglycine-generating enzyme required for sulfatase activity
MQSSRASFVVTSCRFISEELGDINKQEPRKAMALGSSYTVTGLENLEESYRELANLNIKQLVLIAESQRGEFHERYAAGQLLGLFGDPRIKVFDPAMIQIPSARVNLGLDSCAVGPVTEKYRQDGVREEWIRKECPRYQVDLPSYRIGKYLVTHQEYFEFLKDSGYSRFPSTWQYGVYPRHLANHPVYSIEASDADAYVWWLKDRTGRSFRLPTEAEWEYAAAGPYGLEFPWGQDFLKDRANTVESGILHSTPVGIFPRGSSPFGLLDMGGNVEEFVADDYAPYPGGVWIGDDLLRSEGHYRIARGGSFTRFRDLARCKRRHGKYASDLYVMGFRLAETVERD